MSALTSNPTLKPRRSAFEAFVGREPSEDSIPSRRGYWVSGFERGKGPSAKVEMGCLKQLIDPFLGGRFFKKAYNTFPMVANTKIHHKQLQLSFFFRATNKKAYKSEVTKRQTADKFYNY